MFQYGVHALTLPIILNIFIYNFKCIYRLYNKILPNNVHSNFLYIYGCCNIIIKSDYIKRQMELDKLKSEQEKVRAD